MNIREQMEVENKKNNDPLSVLCYAVNRVSVKEITNRKKNPKKEREKENTERALLNASHVRYTVKILHQ